MNAINSIFVSSNHRPVGLYMRRDLHSVAQHYRNERYWLIKDPLEMEFYRLNDEEFKVLNLLDGQRSLDEIKKEFEAEFAPQRITHRQLQTFIADLRKKSLLAFQDGNVGAQLVEREHEKQIEKLKQRLASVLSLKWKGVDPDRFLDLVTPCVGWLFSLPVVICSMLFMFTALLWLGVNFQEFMSKLPGLQAFLAQDNWMLLGVVVIGMKVIHELAHGISFKRFGGECHEIGVMMLVLVIPTLYCSTTDSWLLKSKWKRAAIGAAGMYVEMLIAAFAVFGWWFSEPGNFNMICLNIMATGTISALVLNANPFFKFDGYYIFSDVFELPNLRERAGKQTQSWFLKYFLGIDEPAEPNSLTSTRVWLVCYKLTAFVFKMLIIVMIKFMLIDKLNPYGLGYFGLGIGLVAIVALLAPGVWSLYKFFKVPGRLHRIEMKNSVIFSVVALTLGGIVFLVPFPHFVKCPFTIEPHNGMAVYVEHDAVLREIFVDAGEYVESGIQIARLENLEKSAELAKLKTEISSIEAELSLLDSTRSASANLAKRIGELKAALATATASFKELRKVVDSYAIVAPQSGSLIPKWSDPDPDHGMRLAKFDSTPMSKINVGTWLEGGEQLCTIGDLNQFDAVLAVNEYDISFITENQSVQLMLDSASGHRVSGKIESLALKQTEDLPSSLIKGKGGSIQLADANRGNSKNKKPSDEHFEARVSLPEISQQMSTGLRGHARIRVGSKTIAERISMFVFRSFRRKLN